MKAKLQTAGFVTSKKTQGGAPEGIKVQPYAFKDPGGPKQEMNLFTAINNALQIALETDPKAVGDANHYFLLYLLFMEY